MQLEQLIHSPAITCSGDTPIGEVARRMEERNVGSVVIVEEGDRVTGIVTDRDLAVRGLAHDLAASTPVEEVMTTAVVTVPHGSDLVEATRQMGKAGYRRLPIVDTDGHITGLVSVDDLFLVVSEQVDGLAKALTLGTSRPL